MNDELPAPSGDFLFYTGPDGKVRVECRFQGETIWLTQKLMAELFGVGVPAINKHLSNIFETRELQQEATISKMEIVGKESLHTRFGYRGILGRCFQNGKNLCKYLLCPLQSRL